MDLNIISQLPSCRGRVPLTALNMLPNVVEGDIVIASDLNPPKPFYFTKGQWTELTENGINTNINLYSVNKSVIAHQKSKNVEKERKNISKSLTKYLEKNKSFYHLLYGKEIGYFTFFHQTDTASNTFVDEFIECLKNLGNIYSVEEWNNNLEIWMKTEQEEATVLYLFPYDQGVIEVK